MSFKNYNQDDDYHNEQSEDRDKRPERISKHNRFHQQQQHKHKQQHGIKQRKQHAKHVIPIEQLDGQYTSHPAISRSPNQSLTTLSSCTKRLLGIQQESANAMSLSGSLSSGGVNKVNDDKKQTQLHCTEEIIRWLLVKKHISFSNNYPIVL